MSASVLRSETIHGQAIEYIDETHTYLVDGVIVPSCTQLLHSVFPHKYDGIPASILQSKAAYGSSVHEAIECLEQGKALPDLSTHGQIAIEQYEKLKKENGFTVIDQEQMICYKNAFAGRYDMVIEDEKHRLCMADIKTTSTLDRDYLSYQLSLYELAYEWTNLLNQKYPFHSLYCLWIPKKELAQMVKIERIPRDKLLAGLGL